ncbi:MAG: FAD-dependent oxidoreductase, partial [Pseudomonadota bacterium]
EPAPLRGIEVDEKVVVTSTGALDLPKIPKSMVIIGAGVIGLELGSVYARLGSEVKVIEYLDHITPGMDAEVSKAFQKMLVKQGLEFVLSAAVEGVEVKNNKARVTYSPRAGGDAVTVDADTVLVATGRRPFTDNLGFADLGGEMTDRGQIAVNGTWATNLPGIYAIGDVIQGPMLAHKAEDEGIAVAEVLAGRNGHVDYGIVPGVIYTAPEVASVGKTEEELKAAGAPYKVGKFTFMGNARAKAVFMGDGFVKLLADKDTDRILGCHLIGPAAGDLIHEVCVAMEFGASAEDLAMTCHAHPTFSEAMREAALACGDGPIHS